VARDFAENLSGTLDRGKQLAVLSGWGAEIVGITDGIRGSWFREDHGNEFFQPAFPSMATVDTTGCGDVFHGAFLSELAQGRSVKRCAEFASAAAAWNATALGGRGKLPHRQEVEELIGR